MNETKNYRRAFAQYYKITFSSDYDIHHVDFDRSNNDIGNLFILPKRLHMRYHHCLAAMRNGDSGVPHALVDTSINGIRCDKTWRNALHKLADTMDDIAFWQEVNYLLFKRRQVIEFPPYQDFSIQTEPIEKIASYVLL